MNFRRVALLAALVPFTTLAAQTGRDPYAPAVLLLPASARTLAMGNVGVAGRDDDVLFYNPSQLAIARGMSASAERLSATSATGALSSVIRLHSGGLAVGMRMVDYEAPADFFPVNRATMLDAGTVTGTSVEASIGIAEVIKGLRVGLAAKYVEDNVPTIRASRGAFDFGVSKDMLRTTFALAVQNLGTRVSVPCAIVSGGSSVDCIPPPGFGPFPAQFTSVGLPFQATLGALQSRPLGQFDFVGTAAVSVLRSGFWVPGGGAELGYSWLDGYSIALRAGARRPVPGEGALTAGAGFTMDRLSIDYALETLSDSRVGHRIGLRVR